MRKSESSHKAVVHGALTLHGDQADLGEQLYRTLLGELIDRSTDAWLSKQPAIFHKEPFSRRIQAELAKYTRQIRAEQSFISLQLQDYLSRDHADLQFLRQIERLGLSKKAWNKALADYWGFYAERARLREQGDLLPLDWAARNDELFRRWEDICDCIQAEQEQRNLSIFRQTLQSDYHGPLGGQRTLHGYFTAGNYHALANGEEDQHPLTWHPIEKEEEK